MNAEFLENPIIITFQTTSSGEKYSAKPIRKNLAPTSFIGAMAVTEDGTAAYAVTKAKYRDLGALTAIMLKAGPYILPYMPRSGRFGLTNVN